MKHTFTCLIPFYNEGARVLTTVGIFLNSSLISKIVCIDDGSTDNASDLIKQRFPGVTLIKLTKNTGKANAIKEGLKWVSTEFVLLFDADLYNIKLFEIEAALKKIDESENIDSIILRRIVESKFLSFIRHDIVMSGQRILKVDDFKRVFDTDPKGYAIETAINAYMIKNDKRVFWMPLSTKNPKKHHKVGLGLLQSIKLYIDTFIGYFSFVGPIGYLQQISTFCRQEAP